MPLWFILFRTCQSRPALCDQHARVAGAVEKCLAQLVAAVRLDFRPRGFFLGRADLDDEIAFRFEIGGRRGDQAVEQREAVGAAVERQARL